MMRCIVSQRMENRDGSSPVVFSWFRFVSNTHNNSFVSLLLIVLVLVLVQSFFLLA